MVLTKDYFNRKEIIENPHNFIVLDTKHILYRHHQLALELAIEVTNFINVLNWANEMYKNIGSTLQIDTSIMYEVFQATLEDKPFNEEQIKRYVKTMQDYEDFISYTGKFAELENVYSPSEVELMLLGYSLSMQSDLGKQEVVDLHERYGEFSGDIRFKKITVDQYIKGARSIFKKK